MRSRLRSLRRAVRRPKRRVLALVPFRDEMRFLPGLYENLAPQVDGVIALDDGSSDGSGEFAAAQPLTLQLITVPKGAQGELEDGLNHRALIEAAQAHRADWLLGIDADERVERGFRARAELEFERADRDGVAAFWLQLKELWDSPLQWRDDGIWGRKRKGCLFRADPDHEFHMLRVHSVWAGAGDSSRWPEADIRIYHLRMIEAADRLRRVERYRRIDPDRRWQEIGYEYMLDDSGIELRRIEPGREYGPVGR